jgi:predicted nucleotidyltransferase
MPENVQRLLSELRRSLTAIYSVRLRGVFLFGSYALGDQDGESDVDIPVVLSDYESYDAEIERTSELASALSLK